jgi:hypothetical protein
MSKAKGSGWLGQIQRGTPLGKPRLDSSSPEDEQALCAAREERFRDFLLAAVQTGPRPSCELAQ